MDPSATQLITTNGRSEAGWEPEGNAIAMKLDFFAMNRPDGEAKRAAWQMWLGMGEQHPVLAGSCTQI
jgi:hypothetical protein